MYTEQKVPEDKKVQNLQWNTQRNKNVSIRHRNILNFFLIHRPHRPQMTHWKHFWMTHLIQAQGKTNQTSDVI